MEHFLLEMLQDVLDCILFFLGLPRLKNALRDIKKSSLITFLRLQFQEVSKGENETQFNRLLSLKLALQHCLVFTSLIIVEKLLRVILVLVLLLLGASYVILVDFHEDLADLVMVTTLLLQNAHLSQMLDEDFKIHFFWLVVILKDYLLLASEQVLRELFKLY